MESGLESAAADDIATRRGESDAEPDPAAAMAEDADADGAHGAPTHASPLVLIAVILVTLAVAYVALAQLAGGNSRAAPLVEAAAGAGDSAIR